MISGGTNRRIVKLEEFGSDSAHVAFNFEDIRQKCEAFIEQTQAKATQMLVQAHADGEKIKEAAMQQGIKNGERLGLTNSDQRIKNQAEKMADQKLAESLQTLKPALEQAAEQMRLELHNAMAAWETHLVRLAAQLAQRITRRQIEVEPTLVVDSVQEILKATIGEDRINVHVHPDDAELISSHLNFSSSNGQLPVLLTPDPELSRGDCIVTTSHGQIDARVDSMLDQLANELTGG